MFKHFFVRLNIFFINAYASTLDSLCSLILVLIEIFLLYFRLYCFFVMILSITYTLKVAFLVIKKLNVDLT